MERRQERKVVTVLFCDLVGFTARAEELDPEDVAALLGPYHAQLKEELERYGGTVEKFIGDAVMALFGAPISHEDDPERAVRAALAIRSFAVEDGLELRIGVATGEALVTLDARPDAGETMATGDVVNTAARLQAAAPVNGILVSEKTFSATRDTIAFREREPVVVKGKAGPVAIWEATSARTELVDERTHAAPLVGRIRELDLLSGVLERTCAERQSQLVTIVGVPGIGKSRLVRELSAAPVSMDVRWLHGRCLPYGDGVTFHALAEIVKAQLQVRESDPAEVVEAKLGDVVTDEWAKRHFRSLLGLEARQASGGDREEEAFAAWRSFLEAAAGDAPLVVVFDDLHWADDLLLDFVDHLVDWASGVGMLVVCATRPELLERRPAWGGGKTNSTIVSLAALSDEETAKLVGGLLGRPIMSADVQEALLARAGGNPLYAEQFVRLVEDDHDLRELPDTVQGLIAARLDVLAHEQKALIQDASVIGRSFWLDALVATSGVDARAAEGVLHALERKGFVRRERASTIAGQTEYAFQHVLLADVAYGQIPRAQRSDKHRLAAEWISLVGRPEDTAELRAHHYGEALTLARAARLDTGALEEPARRAFRDAGDRAFDLSAYVPAARLYEQALQLWPASDVDRAEVLLRRARSVNTGIDDSRFDLFEEARDALLACGRLEEAAEAESLGAVGLRVAGRGVDALERVRAAVRLLDGLPSSRAKTYVEANCARLLSVLAFEHEDALVMAQEALSAARELSLPDLEAHCLNTIGVARMGLWDVEGVSDLEESLRIGLEHCSPFEVARIYNNLDAGYINAGLVAEADATSRARLEMAQRLGLPTHELELGVAGSDFFSGRWEAARDRIETLRASGATLSQYADGVMAEIQLARDDVPGAAAACDHALEVTRAAQWDIDNALTLRSLLGMRARIALAEGRDDAARALGAELLAIDLDPGQTYPVELVWLALVLVEIGWQDRASAAVRIDAERLLPWHEAAMAIADGRLVEAADQLDSRGAVTMAADARMQASRGLVADGRRAEADEQLGKALAFYRSVGATRNIREAEALLTQVA